MQYITLVTTPNGNTTCFASEAIAKRSIEFSYQHLKDKGVVTYKTLSNNVTLATLPDGSVNVLHMERFLLFEQTTNLL